MIRFESGEAAWRRFATGFVATVVLLGLAAVGFIAWLDPYGLRVGPGRAPGPIMDKSQRFFYPQIVRSGLYDAAVFGTSTSRLLDPRDLDAAFGAHFANLAINRGAPHEEAELARLFLRHVEAKALIFGLDSNWCEPDTDQYRYGLPFPAWLYEAVSYKTYFQQVSWRTLTMAQGVLLNRFGLAKPKMAANGFTVFTPPEQSYDARRASAHIHNDENPLDHLMPAGLDISDPKGPMPALAWLDKMLADAPPAALKIVAFMPAHVAFQPRDGTPRAERERLCKERVARIGAQRGATVVDFRIASPVTTDDANYWDALHYRLPVARRIVDALKAAQAGGGDDPAGFYKVLTAH
ncbi:hypothetical protein HCU64_15090 [Methylobacterium sp. C25]|uniref:hypothetical protein n=1 Tax=Methylobacterium sp. C25 TaxID=2721622 RepID=UPI001F3DF893|nr:hypothetical protein [Methylobacterium sp. C25]MCE4225084.1 hypothetical protein [Methylobacterium sp. C25]